MASNSNDIYHRDFDPKDYMDTYFNTSSGVFSDDKYLKFILTHLHNTFSSGDVKGDTLMDIGSGPTIYQIMSACEAFKEIIATDLCEKNHQEYKRWLHNEPGAFDWRPVGEMVCELEGDRSKWADKENKIRAAVKQVLRCDVLESNPLDPVVLPQVDCLLSLLCLESASKDYDTFCHALQNITTLLKVGGHLVLCGVLGSRAWMVADKQFPGLPLTEDFLRSSLAKCGYGVKQLEVELVAGKCVASVCDYYGNFYLVAEKQREVK
ncbi:nicotinamide N-methyltransferase-like isoform X2 [Ambystoma mexicanum]|uniref:nicotinamide N-methyltransferase-like isoform X1 n=1 Tax=Ambystoma mexicanum TaxID=8296 RepID=UPI0037E98E43